MSPDDPVPLSKSPTAGSVETVDRCPLCDSQEFSPVFVARDTLHGMPGEWGVVRCTRCGLMHTSPRPNRQAMASFYPEEYQPHQGHFAPMPAQQRPGPIRRLARRILDPKEVVIPDPDRPRRVLEVGCGSGRTLVELTDADWDVHGLEPSRSAAEVLTAHRDLPVTIGTIDQAEYSTGSFDLIIASMVLEHLYQPVEDLRKMRNWLAPGGRLTGSVPNCASWEFRTFAADWYALQVPTHLLHFTPTTLTAVLQRAGFSGVTVFHQRNVSNLMIHLGRWLQRNGLPWSATCLEFPEQGPRTLRLAVRPVASLLAWVRQSGRISFVAETD